MLGTSLKVHDRGFSRARPAPLPEASSEHPTRHAGGYGTPAEPSKRTASSPAANAHARRWRTPQPQPPVRRVTRLRRPPALRRGRNPPLTSRAHTLRHGRACCCEDHARIRPARAGERRSSVTANERRRRAGVKMASGCGSRMRAGGSPLKPSSPGKSEEGNATPARARLASRAMAPHHVRERCARPTWAELWPAR